MTTLSKTLSLEPSQLYVADIAVMTSFYQKQVGLELLESSVSRSLLGHNNVGVIELISKPKLTHANPRDAGLFHNAILFDSRGELARAAGQVITTSAQHFRGTGDHLVSEAFYFDDPEGNGLELYYDRPADTWQWDNGQVKMDTLYIDPIDFINSNASTYESNEKKLGHVHLRVGNIASARAFYIDTLGFDVTVSMPGALFVSVAGYHHHIALNTWMSEGATKRQMTLGLSDIAITLAAEEDISTLAQRLERKKVPFTLKNGILETYDPWNNKLSFTHQ